MSNGGDKSSASVERRGALERARCRVLRPLALVVLLGVTLTAAGRQLIEEGAAAGDVPVFPADYAARFEALLPHLPLRGPLVQVDEESDAAYVAYLTYERLVKRYEQGMASLKLRREIDQGSVHYQLTQYALAPRIVLSPLGANAELYARTKLVIGNYYRAEDVPDYSDHGLEVVCNPGNGVVLWRRP